MIKTTTEYICDKCDKTFPPGSEFFLLQRGRVETRERTEFATTFPVYHDGICLGVSPYTSYHMCEKCCLDLVNFIEKG